MPDCNHEESDTRILVQILHALEQGTKTIEVHTVDTDLITVLAGALFELTLVHPLAEIWVAFGNRKILILQY